jgi:replicative DNA helicase
MAALETIEGEAALIGALLWHNPSIDRVADKLTALDFFEPVHARMYEAIIREASLGRQVNALTLRPLFEDDEGMKALGGLPYLARISGNEAAILSVDEVAAQIADFAHRRRMRDGLMVAYEACADLDATSAEIIAYADEALSGKTGDEIHQPTGGQCIDELLDSYTNKVSGVQCRSIPSLDKLMGPIRAKQLVIMAGRPGMGKTAAALSYGLGAAQAGHGVLFVSLEMSSTELAARMVSDLCFVEGKEIHYSNIRDGDLNDWQRRRVHEVGSQAHALPFSVVDVGSLPIGRLNMLVRRHARKIAARGFSLDLVIVDYLQLLSPDSRGRSNYEAVSEVSRGLKALAKDHGLGVMALAQLSREVEKRPGNRPQLSDLRDSGQIEQDADAVLFLLREEYYLRQQDPETVKDPVAHEAALKAVNGRIEFILAKRRNGVTGQAVGYFHGAYQAVRG